jgi:DNA ligase-1
MLLDGEVIGTSFNELMTQARRKNNLVIKRLNYVVFDILPIETFRTQGRTVSYDDRKQHIRSLFFDKKFKYLNSTINTLIKGEQQLADFYDLIVADGYEGIIIKDLDATYEFKRSKAWIKMKPTETIDVPVVGIEEGTGKYKGMLGALVVDVDGVRVNVGTGFSDEQRKEFWKFNNELYRPLNIIAEIKFQEKTPDGSLRFPVFIQFRPDKSEV